MTSCLAALRPVRRIQSPSIAGPDRYGLDQAKDRILDL